MEKFVRTLLGTSIRNTSSNKIQPATRITAVHLDYAAPRWFLCDDHVNYNPRSRHYSSELPVYQYVSPVIGGEHCRALEYRR